MQEKVLGKAARLTLAGLFLAGGGWVFADSFWWFSPGNPSTLMVRMASSEVATTIFGPLVPAAYLGSFQIQDHGIIGLVWWDWGCAALYLLVAVILLLRERLGLVLVGALSALNVTVLCYQLLGLWFEKSIARNVDPDFMVRAIVQRGMLVVALLGYSALTYFLTRLAMKRRIIALNRSGPFITIHFPSPK